MGWADIRKAARRVVGATFALPAVYTSPAGIETPCNPRRHNVLKVFGDLDREGFAKTIEDVNRIVFDLREVIPEKNGTVLFLDDNSEYDIVNLLPVTDDFQRTEVTLK
jgi:hypothetical protein